MPNAAEVISTVDVTSTADHGRSPLRCHIDGLGAAETGGRFARKTTVFPPARPEWGMLYDVVERPGSMTPAEVRTAYEARLQEVVAERGAEAVAKASGVDEARLEAIEAGESPTLTLSEAAAVLSTAEGAPDAESIVRETRDQLLLGMTTGVVDVDAVASNVDLDLSGQEVQQAIEGRTDLTLDELAAIHQFVAARNER